MDILVGDTDIYVGYSSRWYRCILDILIRDTDIYAGYSRWCRISHIYICITMMVIQIYMLDILVGDKDIYI